MRTLLLAAMLLSGGAVPGATFGGTGVQGASVNYVALPHPGGSTLQVVRREGGEVDRWRNFQRVYGTPIAAYDGSTTGLSADERTLVLSEVSNDYPPKRSRMIVLNPFDLRPRTRLSLPGAYTVHALSPDGRFIYLIRYPSIRDIDRHELTVYDIENSGAPETVERAVGTPFSRVEDGDVVYTLYGPNEPFIRVLDTAKQTVRRVALFGLQPADVTSMRLALEGDTLRVRRLVMTARDGGLDAQPEFDPVLNIDTRTLAPIRFEPPAWTAFRATVTA